jgi:hypothetical protein
MPDWLYALGFIAVLLAIGWMVDRRAARNRRGLIRAASLRFGGAATRADGAVGTAERTRPGSTTGSMGWEGHGGGYPG